MTSNLTPAERCKRWREKNPEKVRSYSTSYYAENKEECNRRTAEMRKRLGYYGGSTQGYANTTKGWAKYKTNALRRSAYLRGYDFNLDYTDIMDLMVPICPVSGLRLDYTLGGHKGKVLPESPSVDRINNELGYIQGNVIIVSQLVNKVKHNLSLVQIQSLLPKMVEFYGRYTK